jgi:hypothetical protein
VPDLFDDMDEAGRSRLRELGWHETADALRGRPMWRHPETGAVVEEAEALAWLAARGEGEGTPQ